MLDVFCHVYVFLDVCFAVNCAVYGFLVRSCASVFLRSLVVWSRSTWSTVVCFAVPCTILCGPCLPGLFDGFSLDRHPPVSGFVLCNFHSYHVTHFLPEYHTHTHLYVYMKIGFNQFIWHHMFSVQISLPITETFRHPFPVFKLSTGSEALRSFSFLTRRRGAGSFPVRFQRFSGNLVIFTDFSCSSLRCWPVLIRPFPVVFQHGTAIGVWGGRDDLPGHC